MGTIGSIGAASGNGVSAHLEPECEPYYDTVALEETDDELRDGKTIRNVSSSLPKMFDRQISADVHCHGPERSSNYINIDYFLS